MAAVEAFDAVDLIRAKRDRRELTTAEIDWLVEAYTRGYVADEQMSAMTMAIFLNGMSRREIRDLTMAMIASGERMDFSGLGKPTSDKHSTGGVGDKITLPLMPLVATFGVAVPQLSGRGLGHTGGTLDKLESIPGWRSEISNDEMFAQLRDVGGVICAAGAGLAPADKKLYALRDITGTVEAIPLIASSIMSTMSAGGSRALVLDVKFGSGAFLQDIERSRELARTMVELGEDAGVATSALLTNMNVPLGRTIGNANEVRESVEVLAGGGPADVRELTIALAREMLALAGRDGEDVEGGRGGVSPPPRGGARCGRAGGGGAGGPGPPAPPHGRAMDTWRRAIAAQGGDPDAELPVAREHHVVTADRDGVLVEQHALPFGIAAWRLGAGRARKQDPVQHAAGIELHAKPGDEVRAGQPLFTLSADEPERFGRALEAVEGAWRIGDAGEPVQDGGPLIADRIGR